MNDIHALQSENNKSGHRYKNGIFLNCIRFDGELVCEMKGYIDCNSSCQLLLKLNSSFQTK